jgi:hypothetical protein
MTNRMCRISVGDSPSYEAATLFVNREVTAWLEEHGRTDQRHAYRKRGWYEVSDTMVSLSGTSISSPILGSVVFDVTFLNEASRRHETIRDIHAQVICSCIAVIIS